MTHHFSCFDCFIIRHAYYTRNSSLHWVHTIEQMTHTHTHKTPHWMLYMDHTMIGTWNFLQFHLPQHWIPSSTHSTLHITPLLPSITPCICPWHSHYTHHPSLLLISQTHNHSQLHTSLHTPSHKLNTLHQSHSIHSLLHDCLIIQFPSSLLDCMPLCICTIFYFASLHEYTIPHSITSFQYRWYPRLHTILYTACTHSSTSFQYSRYLLLYAWLITHTAQDWPGYWNTQSEQHFKSISTTQVLRTGQKWEDTECTRLAI